MIKLAEFLFIDPKRYYSYVNYYSDSDRTPLRIKNTRAKGLLKTSLLMFESKTEAEIKELFQTDPEILFSTLMVLNTTGGEIEFVNERKKLLDKLMFLFAPVADIDDELLDVALEFDDKDQWEFCHWATIHPETITIVFEFLSKDLERKKFEKVTQKHRKLMEFLFFLDYNSTSVPDYIYERLDKINFLYFVIELFSIQCTPQINVDLISNIFARVLSTRKLNRDIEELKSSPSLQNYLNSVLIPKCAKSIDSNLATATSIDDLPFLFETVIPDPCDLTVDVERPKSTPITVTSVATKIFSTDIFNEEYQYLHFKKEEEARKFLEFQAIYYALVLKSLIQNCISKRINFCDAFQQHVIKNNISFEALFDVYIDITKAERSNGIAYNKINYRDKYCNETFVVLKYISLPSLDDYVADIELYNYSRTFIKNKINDLIPREQASILRGFQCSYMMLVTYDRYNYIKDFSKVLYYVEKEDKDGNLIHYFCYQLREEDKKYATSYQFFHANLDIIKYTCCSGEVLKLISGNVVNISENDLGRSILETSLVKIKTSYTTNSIAINEEYVRDHIVEERKPIEITADVIEATNINNVLDVSASSVVFITKAK